MSLKALAIGTVPDIVGILLGKLKDVWFAIGFMSSRSGNHEFLYLSQVVSREEAVVARFLCPAIAPRGIVNRSRFEMT
jgi:hypothetical protein